MSTFELILLAVMATAIVGFAAAFTLFTLVLFPRLQRNAYEARFPVKVPGWDTRLERKPPFEATVEDIALMNECLVEAAVEVGLNRKDAIQKCNNLRVVWYAYDPGVEAESDGRAAQHIRDPWGRTTAEGTPLYVAGWHDGDEIHLVVRPELTLTQIEYDHEATHEMQELADGDDFKHASQRFWGVPLGLEAIATKLYNAKKVPLS